MNICDQLKIKRLAILSGIIMLICTSSVFCGTSQGTHTASSRLNRQMVFTFMDNPEDMKYITKFPLEELMNSPVIKDGGDSFSNYDYLHFFLVYGDGDTLNVDMNWWIFTSELYAEEKFMELNCCSNIQIVNAIDIGKSGYIGDNCLFGSVSPADSNYCSVCFIRNNVVVRITTLMYSSHPNQRYFMDFAKEVDRLLINAEKETTSKEVPAPVISGAEVVEMNKPPFSSIKVKVSASDPKGQKLWFVPLGQPPAIPKSTDGIVGVAIPEVTGFLETIIWVMNEDHIVSVLEKDFFSESPVNAFEDTFVEALQVFTLSQNAPNPFNPSTSIVFSLVRPEHARLTVYDSLGREVAVLTDVNSSAGSHTVLWDGRDAKGNAVSSGVYLYRLEVGGKVETRKMLLAR